MANFLIIYLLYFIKATKSVTNLEQKKYKSKS